MRPLLITAGLLSAILISVAFAVGGPDPAPNADLQARVDALTKELEALKPLPKQITELKEEIRELKLQISVLRAQPTTTPAPSGVPENAIPREFNGATVYFIPVDSNPRTKTRPAAGAKLP